eukprot:5761842-Pyramimonas_sp.AAC.1
MGFHVASTSEGVRQKSTQERLMRFARKHPGRLSRSAMWTMAQRVTPGGEANSDSDDHKKEPPAAASAYFLRVLEVKYNLSKRNRNDMALMCKLLDLLVQNKADKAMDFIVQHLKAVEQS